MLLDYNDHMKETPSNLTQLRQSLLDHFSEEELRTLCFDLGIDYDDLPASGRAAKARELVSHLDRRGRIPEFVAHCAKLRPQFPVRIQTIPPASPPAGAPAPLERASGSPFVVGRPLRATEPIFGREQSLRFIAGELAKFSSVNVVGERRMGKTSLINHLIGHPDQYLLRQPDQPPLVLASVDLQAGVSNATNFYGRASRELLARLPPSRSAEARELDSLRQRLDQKPQASYDEFERVLRRLRDRRGLSVCPVLVVDESERLLDPAVREGFPFPHFFDGVRALITADLLAMVVASRCPLAQYFTDPTRPNSLTSTFPNYFTPFTLSPLDDAAADALLLQPGDHPLTPSEAAEARRWADGHPCHLQVAGQAWYEAKAQGRRQTWARQRFVELKSQSCLVSPAATGRTRSHLLQRVLRAIFVDLPLTVGRLAQHLGARFDDLAAWIIGAVLILLLGLVLLGVITGGDLWEGVKKALGL